MHAKVTPSTKNVFLLLIQAQRRFRERQKTKFTELTGKVEELEGRLGELLTEKVRLEDRTSILEKTLELRRAGSADLDEPSALHRLNSVVWLSNITPIMSPMLQSSRKLACLPLAFRCHVALHAQAPCNVLAGRDSSIDSMHVTCTT